jgi:hypothetical protein
LQPLLPCPSPYPSLCRLPTPSLILHLPLPLSLVFRAWRRVPTLFVSHLPSSTLLVLLFYPVPSLFPFPTTKPITPPRTYITPFRDELISITLFSLLGRCGGPHSTPLDTNCNAHLFHFIPSSLLYFLSYFHVTYPRFFLSPSFSLYHPTPPHLSSPPIPPPTSQSHSSQLPLPRVFDTPT